MVLRCHPWTFDSDAAGPEMRQDIMAGDMWQKGMTHSTVDRRQGEKDAKEKRDPSMTLGPSFE